MYRNYPAVPDVMKTALVVVHVDHTEGPGCSRAFVVQRGEKGTKTCVFSKSFRLV